MAFLNLREQWLGYSRQSGHSINPEAVGWNREYSRKQNFLCRRPHLCRRKENKWFADLQAILTIASDRAKARITTLNELALRASEFAQMEYGFFFNESCLLLAIGYNVTEGQARYKLLRSLGFRSRLANFIAIAQDNYHKKVGLPWDVY